MINFESFIKAPGTEKALSVFKEMANGESLPMLLCIGSNGCGKTHLCYALSSALKEQGIFCPVQYWADIILRLKDTMERNRPPNSSTYMQLFDRLKKQKHLIIDDVGLGTAESHWEWGVFEELVNYKYDRIVFNGDRFVMVVTTNKILDQLPPRVVRRFSDPKAGRIVANKGEDYTRKCQKK